jgi:hypothetical protein
MGIVSVSQILMNGIDTASKFGYLYDVIVDALPMPQSLILQIIRQQDSPAYVHLLGFTQRLDLN